MLSESSRNMLVSDLHRPQYHFLPPSNWMNDPNGVIQWKGQYHLFYQHNPTGALWGNMHWGHAVSPDLIHWTDLPIALAPTPGGPDASGCFSGCAFDNGVPTLLYTGTRGEHNEIQTQCLATSDDALQTWTKDSQNPVLSQIPIEANQTSDFRDPFVWKEGNTWYMVVGSRIKDVGGVVFLYRSANLIDWEYLHPLLAGSDTSKGAIWECPNFFKIGDYWVLIISAHTGTRTDTVHYFVGEYQNLQFTPFSTGVLDYGCMYAPLSFIDDQGRRLLFGWLREERSNEALKQAGWAGVQSIPRVLGLDSQNRLIMNPVAELERIRGQHHYREASRLDRPISIDVGTPSLDIAVEFVPNGGDCGVVVAPSPAQEEMLEVRYEAHSQKILIRKHGESPDITGKPTVEAAHPLAAGEALRLRILLDGSIVEVIGNERTSLSTRFYPTSADRTQIRAFGESAQLRSLDAWEMTSVFGIYTTEDRAEAGHAPVTKG